MAAYATIAELQSFLGGASPPDEGERLLGLASDLLDEKVLVAYEVDGSGSPVQAQDRQTLRDAACAQVEYWIEIGDTVGITSMGQVMVGNLRLPKMRRLAPRAHGYLLRGGLGSRSVG